MRSRVWVFVALLGFGFGSARAQCDTLLPIAVSVKVDSQYRVRLPKAMFDSVERTQYDVEVEVKNNSLRPISIWMMSCSWIDNFEINNNYISWTGMYCDNNFPVLERFDPGESKVYRAALARSIKFEHPCENCIFGPQVAETKVGLIIVDDVYKPLINHFPGYELAMEDKSCWKIVWSNGLYLLGKDEVR